MPTITRPDGASIYYEVHGEGFPLLLFAPGGVNSQVAFWERSVINPIVEFSNEFQVIAMDQRNVGRSTAPMAPFSYETTVHDQLAVLDDVGADKAMVMGGCIGVAYALRIVKEAPERIVAAVCQDPVGLDHTNSVDVFMRMFQPTLELAKTKGVGAVVEAAQENPMFVMNNAGGPFAQQLHDDPACREELLQLSADEYVALIESYAAGIWPDSPPYMSVPESWVPACPAALLILPGSDAFHPTSIANSLTELAPDTTCLDVDCRSNEAKLPGTIESVREFLRAHAR